MALERQKSPTISLNRDQALAVARLLIESARQRSWRILSAAVMHNHVHVLVADCPDDGPTVRRVLKGTTQAGLSRHAGHPRRWWTRGGSDRYLHGEHEIHARISYIARQKGILAQILDMEIVQ
jgi:REP element-mobilizing transposase RayT